MRILLFMVFFSISYMVGTLVGLRSLHDGDDLLGVDDNQKANKKEIEEQSKKEIKRNDLKVAFNEILKTDFRNNLVVSDDYKKINGLESKIDYVSIQKDNKEVSDILSDNGEVGVYLTRILVGDSFRGILFTNQEMDKLTQKYQSELLKRPKETFNAIKEFITTVDQNRYPAQTIGLITFASRLSGVDQDVKELSYEISTKSVEAPPITIKESKSQEDLNIALSTTNEMMVPIVAYIVYIDKETGPILGIERTIDAISAQKSEVIRARIFNEFVLKFPTYRDRLSEQLKDRGILI